MRARQSLITHTGTPLVGWMPLALTITTILRFMLCIITPSLDHQGVGFDCGNCLLRSVQSMSHYNVLNALALCTISTIVSSLKLYVPLLAPYAIKDAGLELNRLTAHG